jgi:hypothetical protein
MQATPSHRETEVQALVKITEVVEATENLDAVMLGAAEQASQTLAEGGIEPFDVGSIPSNLRGRRAPASQTLVPSGARATPATHQF